VDLEIENDSLKKRVLKNERALEEYRLRNIELSSELKENNDRLNV